MCQSVVGRVLVLLAIAMAVAAPAARAADQPLISAPADAFVGEGDGFIDLTVRLSTTSTDSVTVNFATPAITASAGAACGYDYVPVSGTLTFAPGQTSKLVHVAILDCAGAEPAKSFGLSLSTPVNGVIARAASRVTILDNDTVAASPQITAGSATVDEKDGFALVPVILAQASNSAVSVNYATQQGTAAAGDYTSQAGTLSFAAGQVVKTIAIAITDDAANEPAESFTIDLSSPANATVVGRTGTVTIGASDGTATSLPAISTAQDAVVGEADGHVELAVALSAPGTQVVTVKYSTPQASAAAGYACGYDYVPDQGTLTFAPGETTKVIDVELLDCTGTAGETGMLTFTLSLDTPINATIQRSVQRIEIVNNTTLAATPRVFVRDTTVDEKDGQALIAVILGQQSNSVITVDYATAGGTAGAADYTSRTGTLTFAPGQTAKTIAIPIADDAVSEPAERFTLSLANATNATIANATGTVTIGASDGTATSLPAISAAPDAVVGEGDGYADLVVHLSAPGTQPVSVSFATPATTASAGYACGYNYLPNAGTINFAPGETTKVVRVDLLDCAGGGSPLAFLLSLSTPTNATIQRAAQRVEIVGNDTLSATPRIYVKNAFVDEKDGDAVLSVMLGQASNSTITVDYATQDGTATGADYTPQSGTLTFAPGQTVRTITIPIADDAAAEPFETFSLSLANPINATVASAGATITIGASDGTPSNLPTLSAGPDQLVGEGDWYVDLAVRLSAPGTQPVSVHYSAPADSASAGYACNYNYVPASGTLTFAPGETSKVVRVEVLDCASSETLKSFEFDLDTPVNATIARDSQYVSIVDNDNLVAVPSLVVRDATVDEKDGLALVPVLLGGPRGQASNSTITVDYATSSGTAGSADYTPLSGTLTFAPGQTVQTLAIPIADDALDEPAESFAVNLSNALNATIGTGLGAVTIGASDAAASVSPALSAPADVLVGEASGYADLVVRLAAPATLPVTVHYTTPAGTASAGFACGYDYLPFADTLTFAPGETTKVVRDRAARLQPRRPARVLLAQARHPRQCDVCPSEQPRVHQRPDRAHRADRDAREPDAGDRRHAPVRGQRELRRRLGEGPDEHRGVVVRRARGGDDHRGRFREGRRRWRHDDRRDDRRGRRHDDADRARRGLDHVRRAAEPRLRRPGLRAGGDRQQRPGRVLPRLRPVHGQRCDAPHHRHGHVHGHGLPGQPRGGRAQLHDRQGGAVDHVRRAGG